MRKLTSKRVRLVPLLLGLSLFPAVAASAKEAEGPPPVKHPLQGVTDCLVCHGQGKARPAPADHQGNANGSCLGCHEATAPPADPKINFLPGESTNGKAAALSANCRVCHDKPEFHIVSHLTTRSDTKKQLDGDRAYAHRFVACVTCHGSNPHSTMHPVTKKSVAVACGQCHVAQRHEHETSVHGKSLEAGGKDAAGCIDCHSTQNTPHSIARVLSPESPAYRSSVATTCAKCHSRPDVMGRYGIETVVYKTYLSNFHGKANVLSPYEITQHPKATCVTCHGYHDIKDKQDPTSPVHKANLASTCGGCHPGAGKKFAAAWMGHKEATPQQYPLVYFAERFFFTLTSSVLTFGFVFMVALDVGSRFARRKTTRHPVNPPNAPPTDPVAQPRSKEEDEAQP